MRNNYGSFGMNSNGYKPNFGLGGVSKLSKPYVYQQNIVPGVGKNHIGGAKNYSDKDLEEAKESLKLLNIGSNRKMNPPSYLYDSKPKTNTSNYRKPFKPNLETNGDYFGGMNGHSSFKSKINQDFNSGLGQMNNQNYHYGNQMFSNSIKNRHEPKAMTSNSNRLNSNQYNNIINNYNKKPKEIYQNTQDINPIENVRTQKPQFASNDRSPDIDEIPAIATKSKQPEIEE